MNVCVCLLPRRPNQWTKWAEIWHAGGDGQWNGLWVDVICPSIVVTGKNAQKYRFQAQAIKCLATMMI